MQAGGFLPQNSAFPTHIGAYDINKYPNPVQSSSAQVPGHEANSLTFN